MKRVWILFPSIVLLSGCFTDGPDFPAVTLPLNWTAQEPDGRTGDAPAPLKNWWLNFQDPALTALTDFALEGSPDRRIAAARIAEARGARRSARAALFPELNALASGRREDTGFTKPDEFYDATFDASFELDIFGENRNRNRAARATLSSLEAAYDDVSLSLIGEVARTYAEYRAARRQTLIAEKNLGIQNKTLDLIRALKEAGENTRLDVERAAAQTETTRAAIPEFRRLADNARLRLGVLTGRMPEDIRPILEADAPLPHADALPLLAAPAAVLAGRPDIRAAAADLEARTALTKAETAALFPSFTLGGFYGVQDSAFANSATVWNIALGAAVTLLDFGRIEGRIDSARAREVEAYETYRRTLLQAVAEVETALGDYAEIRNRRAALERAFNNAGNAFSLSQTLFREGEISVLDVLDSQRTVNEAEAALVNAEEAQFQALVRLYKALGVY